MLCLIDLTGHLCLTWTLSFSPAERMLSHFLIFYLSDELTFILYFFQMYKVELAVTK